MRAVIVAVACAGCSLYFGPGDRPGAGTPDAAEPSARPSAPAGCAQVEVYVDLDGGTWTPGYDARDRTSGILTAPATFAPTGARAPGLVAALRDALAYYHVPITTTRPAGPDAYYFELVLAGDGLGPAFPGQRFAAPRTCMEGIFGVGFVDATGATDDVVASTLHALGMMYSFRPTARDGDCMNEGFGPGCRFGRAVTVADDPCGYWQFGPADEAQMLATDLGCAGVE